LISSLKLLVKLSKSAGAFIKSRSRTREFDDTIFPSGTVSIMASTDYLCSLVDIAWI
jgi:hypothetical protein